MSDVRSHELAPQYRREGKACYSWQGLGNRIGHQVGPISDELKADLYAVLAKVKEWQAEQGVREHPEREAAG